MEHLVSYINAFNAIRGSEQRAEGEWVSRWIYAYLLWRKRELDIYTTMALIHPDFDPNGIDETNFAERAKGPCSIAEYVGGMSCPSENKREVVQYENDHSWPRSLGGRTTPHNRKSLCRYCNGMKGDNPHFWHDWDSPPPTWVRELIEGIRGRIGEIHFDKL